MWSTPRPSRFAPGKWTLYTRYTEGWVGRSVSLDGFVKFHPYGFRSLDLPALKESLHRLSYSGRHTFTVLALTVSIGSDSQGHETELTRVS